MIENIAKKSLSPLIDKGLIEQKRLSRLGEIDGKSEEPSTEANELSEIERQFIDLTVEKWRDFKTNILSERQRLDRELVTLGSKITHDVDPSAAATASEQIKAIDLLEVEIGSSSTAYNELRSDLESSELAINDLKSQLNRPMSISFKIAYIPLMFVLSISELFVNRLSFELIFESMPIVSIILAAAVGILLIFFAHIIGTQVKRSQCPLTAIDNTKTYWAIFSIALISIILMYSLAMMRQQLLDLSAVNVELDDLLKESSDLSNGTSILPSGKSIPFLVINFAIFISGVVLAFFRHDSHPFYEKYDKDFQFARKNFNAHLIKYEKRQVELAREYNNKINSSELSRVIFEKNIKEIEDQLKFLNGADSEYRDRYINEILACIREYRQKNTNARKTPPPEYFKKPLDELIRGLIT